MSAATSDQSHTPVAGRAIGVSGQSQATETPQTPTSAKSSRDERSTAYYERDGSAPGLATTGAPNETPNEENAQGWESSHSGPGRGQVLASGDGSEGRSLFSAPDGKAGGALAAERDRPRIEKFTERDLLDRLRRRHSVVGGNGPEWAYMEHVRDCGGFANRTIDALALHYWPSRNHEVHAFEVKVTRADFRRELADPSKAAAWTDWVEYFWLVAPAGVIPVEEVPREWGLLVTHGEGLRKVRQAHRLREKPAGYLPAPDLPRTVVAAMLRAQVRNGVKRDGYWQSLDSAEGSAPDSVPDEATA